MVCWSPPNCMQGHHVGTLKLTIVGVLTLRKMAVATSQVFCWFVCFLKRWLLNIYQHTTGEDPRERGKHDAVAHGNLLVSSLHQTEVQRALERESRDPSSRPGFAPEGS